VSAEEEAAAAAEADAAAADIVDSFQEAVSVGEGAAAAAAAAAPSAPQLALRASAAERSARPGAVLPPAAAAAAAAARRSALKGIPELPVQWGAEWEWQEALLGGKEAGGSSAPAPSPAAAAAASAPPAPADSTGSSPPSQALVYQWQWCALLLDSAVHAPLGSLVIGSRLDADLNANACRLAFYGRLAAELPAAGSAAAAAAARPALPAPIRPGDMLILRYKKYLFQGRKEGGKKGSVLLAQDGERGGGEREESVSSDRTHERVDKRMSCTEP
jgi:hypothetical protein